MSTTANTPRIGFVGFGAVASTFVRPMAARGVEVCAYDILLEKEDGLETLRRRAGGSAVRFLPVGEVASQVDCVLSTAATDVALEIASVWAAHLRPGQTFIDMNSTAPQVKVAIGEAIAPSGAPGAGHSVSSSSTTSVPKNRSTVRFSSGMAADNGVCRG